MGYAPAPVNCFGKTVWTNVFVSFGFSESILYMALFARPDLSRARDLETRICREIFLFFSPLFATSILNSTGSFLFRFNLYGKKFDEMLSVILIASPLSQNKNAFFY